MAKRTKTAAKKKRYYHPPSALDKIRHKLADGTPTHELLHYMHGREKLPTDVKDIAEAAENLHQVRTLLESLRESTAIAEIGNGVEQGCSVLISEDIDKAIKMFMIEARKALVMKTMKEPEEV